MNMHQASTPEKLIVISLCSTVVDTTRESTPSQLSTSEIDRNKSIEKCLSNNRIFFSISNRHKQLTDAFGSTAKCYCFHDYVIFRQVSRDGIEMKWSLRDVVAIFTFRCSWQSNKLCFLMRQMMFYKSSQDYHIFIINQIINFSV